MTKFKIGQRVKFVDDGGYILDENQKAGTITEECVDGRKELYRVDIDNYRPLRFLESELLPETPHKTVKRKAGIGERILITDAVNAFGEYDNGDIFTVEKYFYGVSSEGVNVRELPKDCEGHSLQIYDREYEVIIEEPTQASTHNENLVLTRLFNAEAEVDRMSRSIDELKRRIETLEKAEKFREYDEAFKRIAEVTANYGKEVVNTFKTPNERRADVIKRAEAFVAEIESEAGRSLAQDDSYIPFVKENGGTFIEFIVNAEKRTVVALAHFKFAGGIAGKAFARCAPGDVFNDKIGMAIAAGRLYGVTIPQEFLDAPQPTEVVVGMRVDNTFRHAKEHGWGVGKIATIDRGCGSTLSRGYSVDGGSWSFLESVVILDDSEAVYE